MVTAACAAAVHGDDSRADTSPSLPAWAVPYGAEFWHPIHGARVCPEDGQGPVRLGEAIDRVSHAFQTVEGRLGVRSRDYRVLAAPGGGWRFEPRAPSVPAGQDGWFFRTSEILRGGRPLPLASSPDGRACGNTVQTRLRTSPGLVEHIEARGAGVEISWVMDAAPPGEGDLEIRMAVDGLSPAGRTAAGLHFADARGVPRVRIGPARAVDSKGRTWPLQTSHAAGSLAVLVPAAALREAAWPMAVDPLISAEFGLDTSVHLVPDPDMQGDPAVATDGTNWFVAWTTLGGLLLPDADIRAARVSPAGAVLDPEGIAVSSAPDWQIAPSVTWNGTNFFVVWEDGRSGADTDIYGARVTPSGAVLDAAGIALCTVTNDQRAPSVAWNSGVHYVTWEEGLPNVANIRGARVTFAGAVLDVGGSNVCSAAGRQSLPSAAPLGAGFLVVWDDMRGGVPDIYGTRIDSAGVVLDPAGLAISTADDAQQNPALAWNGTNCVVVWGDARDGLTFNIHGTRVAPDGAVLDTNGFPVCTESGDQDEASIAWTGDRFVVAWADWRNGTNSAYDVYASRMDAGGAVLDGGGILVVEEPGDQAAPAVAALGTNTLVAWTDGRRDSDIYAARFAAGGAVLDAPSFAVSIGPNRQFSPAVASDGTHWLAVWEDDRGGAGFDLYAVRTDATGRVLDASGFVVTAATNGQRRPCVLWNGSNYFAAWTDYRVNGADGDIFATRISPAGAVLDPAGIPVCTNGADQEGVAASWDGTNHLCVWTDQRGPDPDIYAARISAAGVALDPVTNLQVTSWTGTAQFNPAVAWNGTTHLVVWQDYRNGQADLYGARVVPGGTVLDISGLALCTETNDQAEPAISWDGARHLLAWSDSRGETNTAIYAGRLSAAGTPLDGSGFAVARHGGDAFLPRSAWDGYTHVIAWNRMDPDGNTDVRFARVSEEGTVDDPEGLTALTDATEAAVAARAGRVLIAGGGPRDGASRAVAVLVANDKVRIDVASTFGAPSPAEGSHVYDVGASVAPSVAGSPVTGAATQFVCTGWSGTGSVPAGGSGTNIPAFALAQDSTLRWLWQTNFFLDTAASNGGSVPAGEGWHPAGQNVQVTAVASSYYHFASWSGTVPAGSETNNPVDLPMDRARAIAAGFAPNLAVHGVPEWWLAAHGFTNDFDAAALADQDRDGHATWMEWTGQTDPTNASSFFAASRIRWVAGQTVVSWPSASNRLYSVERATNVASGGWAGIATDLPATPAENSYTDAPPAGTRTPFYRVRVRAP